MKIIRKKDSLQIKKPEGTKVDYFLRDEYELHYNEKIWEMIDGELTVCYKKDGRLFREIVYAGDFIETENTMHTFINHTDRIVRFKTRLIVFKQVLQGVNKRDILKNDKILENI